MKKLFKWVSISAVICSSIWFAFDYWTAVKLEKECLDWPLFNRNLGELSQVYPTTSGSQSTKDLQALYEKSSFGDAKDGPDIRQLLKNYLRKELESPVAMIGLLPQEIKKSLLENHEVIEQISRLLTTENILTLPLDLTIGPDDEIPAIFPWVRPINDLLVASALSSQLNGDMYQAWHFLEASARLNDALFLQPFLISQVLAIVESRDLLVVMRKLTVPVPDWALDWPKHDFATGMLMAYTAEARFKLTMAEKTNLESLLASDNKFRQSIGLDIVEAGIVTKIVYTLAGRQLFRIFASEWIASMRRIIQQRSREGLCVSQPSQLVVIKERTLPWYPGKALLSSLYSCGGTIFDQYWYYPYLLEIYKAGTQVILQTKTMKVKNAENRWPRTPVVPAETCLAHSWSYQHKPDGSVIFSYDKPLPEGIAVSRIKPEYLKYIGSADE